MTPNTVASKKRGRRTTNAERLFHCSNRTPYVKEGIGRYLVDGHRDAVNPANEGTKASAHYALTVGAGESRTLRLRLSDVAPAEDAREGPFGAGFDSLLEARRQEADEFYASVIPASQVRELDKLAAIVEAQPSPTEVARVKAAPRKAQ